ncbi:MAG TPA: hypothetical protein VF481_03870 [Novosphingobium sp.]
MQTERVTFLTSPEHKAALDAFAAERGESVGNVVREATVKYMHDQRDGEEELAALVAEVNAAVPRMRESLDHMSEVLRESHAEMDAFLREKGIRR